MRFVTSPKKTRSPSPMVPASAFCIPSPSKSTLPPSTKSPSVVSIVSPLKRMSAPAAALPTRMSSPGVDFKTLPLMSRYPLPISPAATRWLGPPSKSTSPFITRLPLRVSTKSPLKRMSAPAPASPVSVRSPVTFNTSPLISRKPLFAVADWAAPSLSKTTSPSITRLPSTVLALPPRNTLVPPSVNWPPVVLLTS